MTLSESAASGAPWPELLLLRAAAVSAAPVDFHPELKELDADPDSDPDKPPSQSSQFSLEQAILSHTLDNLKIKMSLGMCNPTPSHRSVLPFPRVMSCHATVCAVSHDHLGWRMSSG